MCMCVCPPPCLVSCTEQLPRESPCQKPRQNIKTCNTFCITVTQYTLFFFFLVINFKNKNPFSSKEKQDKTIEIYFSKKKKEKKKLSAPLPKTVEEEQGVCGGGGSTINMMKSQPTQRDGEQGVCVYILLLHVYRGSIRSPTDASRSLRGRIFFLLHQSTHQHKKGKKSMRIKVGLFFPFYFIFFLDTENARRISLFRFDSQLNAAAPWWQHSICKDESTTERHDDVVQLRATRSLHDGWSSPQRKRRKNEFSRLSPRCLSGWREFCDIYRDMRSHIRERIIATLENT